MRERHHKNHMYYAVHVLFVGGNVRAQARQAQVKSKNIVLYVYTVHGVVLCGTIATLT